MPDDTSVKMQQLEELQEATNRLVRTVDGFQGDDWGGASGLPGWTRAHVVAHLALNAEGLAGALTGIVQDEPTPMYASQEDRDRDIEELAGDNPAELRERLLAGCTLYADAWTALPDDAGGATFERTAGGPTLRPAPRSGCGCGRWRSTTSTSRPATPAPTGRPVSARSSSRP